LFIGILGGKCLQPGKTKITETTTRQQDLYRQAASLLSSGDAPGASAACDRALAEFPDDGNLLCLSARASLAAERTDVARERIDAALARYPEFALAHETLGDVLLVGGQAGEAREAYERALELDPGLALARRKLDRARELEAAAATTSRRRRRAAFASDIATAEAQRKSGDNDKAEAICRRILREDPDHVEAARLLAGIATDHERFREAEVFLRRATELAPKYARAWVDLANVQRHLDRYDDAVASAERVVELSPGTPESYMVLASALGAAGRHEEAIVGFRKVIDLDPGKRAAHCALGHHLKTLGRSEEAVSAYRQSIAVAPEHGEAWWSLANLKTFRFDDDEVEQMEALLETDALSTESRLQIHNALGLEFEGRRQYARAFEQFAECNRLRRDQESYDPVDTESTHDRVIELFDAGFLAQPGGNDADPVPIFIVGLPRSGSTLLEQILASHSQVEGTHELTELSKVLGELKRHTRGDRRFPEIIGRLNQAGWTRIGREYLERTAQYRSGSPCFIDKNPNNFVFAGVIRLALPNAKIINARRHPLDSCLGTYKQLFASGQPFSYDLVELGEYYLQYDRLMQHWHDVMPGFVLDVNYEDVVSDLEGQVRRLLEFCGLPFEDACLRFHETARAVKTASSEQVRRPIYSSSVDLWRNYRAEIATLAEILDPILQGLPASRRP
jgi:tetratricopeptide (TPR) repeat protein